MSTELRPRRADVVRIIDEEAAAAGIDRTHVIQGGVGHAPEVAAKAMRRIVAETGCSASGLADVWGCHRNTVSQALRAAAPAPPETYAPQPTNFRRSDEWSMPLAAAMASLNFIDSYRGMP